MDLRILIPCALALLGSVAGAAAGSRPNFPPVSKLKPHPGFPNPLLMADGSPVRTRKQWEKARRPELKAYFQHYMYGLWPDSDGVRSSVVFEDRKALNGKATLREVVLRWRVTSPPTVGEAPPLYLLQVIPNRRRGPAPVFVGINFAGNHTVLPDPRIRVPDGWMYPNYPGVVRNRASEAGRGAQVDVWNVEKIIDRGWALATFYNGDVQPDNPELARAATAFPPETATIARWAFGASRVADYLVRTPEFDRRRIAVVGHSRNGKASLVAAAFDERFALAIPHQAGCGGTAPSRGKIGESVTRINTSFPHWFNSTFKQFNDRPELLPFDQHALVALVAPRPVLFSNATEDTWANPEGQFDVLKAADPVYRFLGVEGLAAQQRPPVGKLLDSRLGYFIRPGKHSMTPEDWDAFLAFADRHLRRRGA